MTTPSSNLAIMVGNLVDLPNTTVTCVGATDPAPSTELQNPEIAATMVTEDLDATDNTIVITLGADHGLTNMVVGVAKGNWTVDAVMTVVWKDSMSSIVKTVVSNADDYGFFEEPIDDQYRNIFIAIALESDLPILFRSIEISIADSGNPDGYLEISRAFALPIISTARGFDIGNTVTFSDPSDRDEGDGGNPLSYLKVRRREISFTVKNATQLEMLNSLGAYVDEDIGKTEDALVMLYPPWSFQNMASYLHRRMVWGYQSEVSGESMDVWLGVDNEGEESLHSRSFTFIERT